MTKVRDYYPASLKFLLLTGLAALFYAVAFWTFGNPAAAVVTAVFVTVACVVIICDSAPLWIDGDSLTRRGKQMQSSDVASVTAKTVTSKWLSGAAVTVTEIEFRDAKKITLTDARYPILVTRSGYTNKEAGALISWLGTIPSGTAGYGHVVHLLEMLRTKNFHSNA